MKFHYHKSAKSRGIEGIVICSVFLSILLGGWFFLVFMQEQQAGIIFGSLMGLFTVILMPVLFYWNYRLIKNPDVWDIRINESEVIWNAPEGIGEESFQVLFSDIANVICEVSGNGAEGTDSYSLELIDGKQINLKPSHSGVNINKFINVLKQQGVNYICR